VEKKEDMMNGSNLKDEEMEGARRATGDTPARGEET
jgi:hypothetical protein